jgi:superfamily II DNA or RNA helicase
VRINETGFTLRGHQPGWIKDIERDEQQWRRLLVVAPGGIGKGSLLSYLAWKKNKELKIKSLITINRDKLVRQTADRVRSVTGLDVDIEMGKHRASPYADVVVACTPTIGRHDRLTSFAPDHFGLVMPDECHVNTLSPQANRVLNYFHYGSGSLTEGWQAPTKYDPLSTVVGFTATPNIGTRRNLGTFFQRRSVNYSYLTAIEDGWLVGLQEINIPIRVDTRKFRRKQTPEGAAFNDTDQAAAIAPVIGELAKQIKEHASDRKTIAFLPSVETARMMADAINAIGLRGIFVSGDCLDKNDKTDAYNAAGPGTVLCNCALVTYGVDFVDTSCIAPFRAFLSESAYCQALYRGTRVLAGLVNDEMTADERRAVIAASAKKDNLVLSPFFQSDRIDICAPYDMFGIPPDSRKYVKTDGDFTDTRKIRDGIVALEKAADKHAHKQPRTINPVAFALSIGEQKLASYQPTCDADLAPPSRAELDLLLKHDISSVDIKNSGQAQLAIRTLIERERLGRATPKQLQQLTLRLHWPEEKAALMSKSQAGVMIYKGIHYKAPKEEVPVEDHGDPFAL